MMSEHIHVDRMEVVRALIEWRDARRATVLVVNNDPTAAATWSRLGKAEHELMVLAEKLPTSQEVKE